MSGEPESGLTWPPESAEDSSPGLQFPFFDSVKNTEITYSARFKTCGNPRCPDLHLVVECVALAQEGQRGQAPSASLWVDVERQGIETPPEGGPPDPFTARLGETLLNVLSDSDWKQLEFWFWQSKVAEIEGAAFQEVDISDVPVSQDYYIRYEDVFPLGTSLFCKVDNTSWGASEEYCVKFKCPCSTVMLAFEPNRPSSGTAAQAVGPEAQTVVRYDYRTQAAQVVQSPSGAPEPLVLLEALKAANPALNDSLESHHLTVQALHLARMRVNQEKQLAILKSKFRAVFPNVGRNDLCPCGSGKKYKRCCGRK